jgi:hypothetical protein
VGRSTTETQLSGESLGWMLPLSVFCPVYRWDQRLPLWWYSQFWKFIRPAAYFCEFQSQKFSSYNVRVNAFCRSSKLQHGQIGSTQ